MSTNIATAEWKVESAAEREFDYRPVPPLVPVSAAFAFLSLSAFLWDVLLVVPAIGLVLALLAVWRVKSGEGQYGGLKVATASAVAMPLIAAAAVGFHAYAYATELPEGFRRVSFTADISDKGLVFRDGQVQVDPAVKQLDGEAIFLKGFMYPTQQTKGLTSFVLCKDAGQCCFGGNPKVTDMIFVEMQPGKTVNYRPGLVAVAGRFRIHPTVDATGLNPVYKLETSYFSAAKTAY
uniref:DUF3299 domain-containing protein n=1 Tax=Schlesneria paludicola TaxID=360056 RepID=A0A7C4QPK5_9PLAN